MAIYSKIQQPSTDQNFQKEKQALKVETPQVGKSLWEKFKESGDIYKKKYKGFYCAGCEAFKTQKELIDGKCVIHQKPVEIIEEENYFFKLSKYLPEIKKIIEAQIQAVKKVGKEKDIFEPAVDLDIKKEIEKWDEDYYGSDERKSYNHSACAC